MQVWTNSITDADTDWSWQHLADELQSPLIKIVILGPSNHIVFHARVG